MLESLRRLREDAARVSEELGSSAGARLLEVVEELDRVARNAGLPESPQHEDDLADRVRRREKVADLSALPTSSIQDVAEAAARAVAEALQADCAKVLELLPGGDLLVRGGHGLPDGMAGAWRDAAGAGSQAGFTIETHETVVVEDLGGEARFSVAQALLDLGLTSCITAVIPGKHRPYGVLQAASKQRRGYSHGDRRFMAIAANMVGAAISLVQSERAVRVHQAVSRAFSGARSVEEVVQRFLPAVAATLEFEAASIWRPDSDGAAMHSATTWTSPSFPQSYPRGDVTFRPGEGSIGRTWADKQVLRSSDVKNDTRFRRRADMAAAGLVSCVCLPIPMRGRDEVAGVLELLKAQSYEPDADILATLEAVVRQLGGVMERMDTEQRLRRREHEFRALVENSPDPIGRYDRDLRVLYANPAVERSVGTPSAELVGRSGGSGLPEEVTVEWRAAARKAFDTGQEQVADVAYELADGLHIFQNRIVPEFGEDGSVVSVLTMGRDITAMKRAEEDARAREREFRTLVENSPDVVVRYDRQMRRLYVNPSAGRLLGAAPEDLTGAKVGERTAVVIFDDELVAAAERAFQTGEVQTAEVRVVTPEGERSFNTRVVPEVGEDGSVVSVFTDGRDVTEMKRSQAEATAQYQQLRALVQASPIGIVIADARSRTIILSNREYERLVDRHRRPGETLDSTPRRIVVRTTNGTVLRSDELPLRRAVNKGEFIQAEELLIQYQDGTTCPMIATAAPVLDENGEVAAAITVLQDVTPLRQLDRLRTDFLAMVGHELRTPLAIIRLAIGSLLTEDGESLSEEVLEAFQTVDGQAARMASMISNLRDVAQIEAGAFSVHTVPADLREVVEEARGNMAKAGVPNVEVRLPTDLPPVPMDRARVLQVMENLLTNASRYGRPGKPIRVEVEPNDGLVTVHVRNEGPGIPKDRQELLFMKYARLERSRGDGGSGLGLAISKGIVEAHGGSIWVDSAADAPVTTFSFTLPARAADVAQAAAPRHLSLRVPSIPHPGRQRVLAVDDEPQMLRHLKRVLDRAGFETTTVSTPGSVLSTVERTHPDVVLLDVRLRGTSGFDVFEQVRRFDVPVIFVTVSAEEEDRRRALGMGADDYLIKPVPGADLVASIEAALRKHGASAAPTPQ